MYIYIYIRGETKWFPWVPGAPQARAERLFPDVEVGF